MSFGGGTAAATSDSAVNLDVGSSCNHDAPQSRIQEIASEVLRLRLVQTQHRQLEAQLKTAAEKVQQLPPDSVLQLANYIEHARRPGSAKGTLGSSRGGVDPENLYGLMECLCVVCDVQMSTHRLEDLLSAMHSLLHDPQVLIEKLIQLPIAPASQSRRLAPFLLNCDGGWCGHLNEAGHCYETLRSWLSCFYQYSLVSGQVQATSEQLQHQERLLEEVSRSVEGTTSSTLGGSSKPSWMHGTHRSSSVQSTRSVESRRSHSPSGDFRYSALGRRPSPRTGTPAMSGRPLSTSRDTVPTLKNSQRFLYERPTQRTSGGQTRANPSGTSPSPRRSNSPPQPSASRSSRNTEKAEPSMARASRYIQSLSTQGLTSGNTRSPRRSVATSATNSNVGTSQTTVSPAVASSAPPAPPSPLATQSPRQNQTAAAVGHATGSQSGPAAGSLVAMAVAAPTSPAARPSSVITTGPVAAVAGTTAGAACASRRQNVAAMRSRCSPGSQSRAVATTLGTAGSGWKADDPGRPRTDALSAVLAAATPAWAAAPPASVAAAAVSTGAHQQQLLASSPRLSPGRTTAASPLDTRIPQQPQPQSQQSLRLSAQSARIQRPLTGATASTGASAVGGRRSMVAPRSSLGLPSARRPQQRLEAAAAATQAAAAATATSRMPDAGSGGTGGSDTGPVPLPGCCGGVGTAAVVAAATRTTAVAAGGWPLAGSRSAGSIERPRDDTVQTPGATPRPVQVSPLSARVH